jgi:hypothetical protein
MDVSMVRTENYAHSCWELNGGGRDDLLALYFRLKR